MVVSQDDIQVTGIMIQRSRLRLSVPGQTDRSTGRPLGEGFELLLLNEWLGHFNRYFGVVLLDLAYSQTSCLCRVNIGM